MACLNTTPVGDGPRKVRLIGRPVTRLSMVNTEESAEAVAPLHGGGRVLRRCRVLQKPVQW